MIRRTLLLSGVILLLILRFSPFLSAHQVPKQHHDRNIKVALSSPSTNRANIHITVHYRLELDERTALEKDLHPFLDKIDVREAVDKRDVLYSALLKFKAPQIAGALRIKIDDQPITWKLDRTAYSLTNEQGQLLGHLRCDFYFHASVPVSPSQDHKLSFHDGTYMLDLGRTDVSLNAIPPITLSDTQQASEELKKKSQSEWSADDEQALRSVSTQFRISDLSQVNKVAPQSPQQSDTQSHQDKNASNDSHSSGLLELFMSSKYSVWILIILSTLFGAVHALTPGHGKTLVAAYLVGERGTALHAIVLGLVTTLTHTGVVILLAIVLLFVPMDHESKEAVQFILGLGMGLVVAGLGFWLLLKRLSGQVDHIHIGRHGHHHHHDGHHHHHHHHHHDHDHDKDGNSIPKKVSWWGLIVLGMSGGIIPCWDAVAMLLVAIGKSWFWLALPMLLAFSAGLAGVLVIIGLLVVYAKRFTESHWGSEKLVRILSVLSALAIIAIGIWLCYDSL